MTTQTLAELFDNRAELVDEIVQTEKRVRELRADLTAIEHAIRVLRPGISATVMLYSPPSPRRS